MRTVELYLKGFLSYMNHLQKVVLLSDTQAEGEVEFQWTKHWKRRRISQQNGHTGITGISRRKQAVCEGNVIKHEKAKCKNFLHE